MSKTLRNALGGALVGALFGAALGVGIARMNNRLPNGERAVAQRLDANRAFALGMSVIGVLRQLAELGK